MDKEELKDWWAHFCEGNDFRLNPDEAHVDMIAEGVLLNERECGLKLCPCRIRDGTRERDLALICPCNFKSHETWTTESRCWCGLFFKRK